MRRLIAPVFYSRLYSYCIFAEQHKEQQNTQHEKQTNKFFAAVLLTTVLCSSDMYAGNGNGNNGNGNGNQTYYGNGHAYGHDKKSRKPDVPLDGGLSFLVAAGAGLGVKKYKENKAKKLDK